MKGNANKVVQITDSKRIQEQTNTVSAGLVHRSDF